MSEAAKEKREAARVEHATAVDDAVARAEKRREMAKARIASERAALAKARADESATKTEPDGPTS